MTKRGYNAKRSTQNRKAAQPYRVNRKIIAAYCLAFIAGGVLTLAGTFFWLKRSSQISSLPVDYQPSLKFPLLPNKPKERWRYIEALENKTVVVLPDPLSSTVFRENTPSMTLPTPVRKTQWYIRCDPQASSKSPSSLRAHLALLGFESILIKEGSRTQLLLGPYSQRLTADNILQKLNHHQIACCTVDTN